MLSYFILIIIAGSKYKCDSLMEDNNISAISWRPVLVVEEAGVPGENQRLWASNW